MSSKLCQGKVLFFVLEGCLAFSQPIQGDPEPRDILAEGTVVTKGQNPRVFLADGTTFPVTPNNEGSGGIVRVQIGNFIRDFGVEK